MHNIGIIGFGKMGQIRHKAIENSGRGKTIAVYDKEPVNNEFPAKKTAHDIINNKSVDVVFICTPNFLNKPLTIQALEAGKNVFCEKPPAFSANDVKEIMEVEKRSGKKLMYGFNHRHHGSVKNMKLLIDSQEYGKVLWLRGRYGKSVDQTYYNNWRAKKELAGGGILIDQGIHMLDLFLHLGGEFDLVQSMISNLYWNLEVEDNAFVNLQNSSTGVVASLHSTMTQWRHLFSLEVFLSKGYMVLNGLKTSSNSYGDEVLTIAKNRSRAPAATWEDEEKITYHTDQSWSSEIDEFFSAIDENREVKYGNSNDALSLMQLIDSIYSQKKI